MQCIKYGFQVGCIDEISYVLKKLNSVDVLTKPNSPLSETLELLPFTGRL